MRVGGGKGGGKNRVSLLFKLCIFWGEVIFVFRNEFDNPGKNDQKKPEIMCMRKFRVIKE